MKVYCPSHKRPDAPLFKYAKNLNIILNTDDEQEIADYKRYNEERGHTIINIDYNKWPGLTGALNWMLEQDNDWYIQTDDDITEIQEWNEEQKQYITCDWNYFIEYLDKMIYQFNNKTAMIGLRYTEKEYSYTNFINKDFILINNYEKLSINNYLCYNIIILNNKLLKQKKFLYDGWPNPLNTNQKYGNDNFIQFWCEFNQLQRYLINIFTFKINYHNYNDSIFNNNYIKTKKELIINHKNTHIWFLYKFKENKLLLNYLLGAIDYFNNKLKSEEENND